MVADFESDSGVERAVLLQNGEQDAMQGDLACRNKDRSLFQIAAFNDFRLPRLDILKCDADMLKQPLALGGQLHAAVVSDEQRTPQFTLQRFNGAGQVGLVVEQNLCRLRDVPVFRYIIKYPVIIITDVHPVFSFCDSFLT